VPNGADGTIVNIDRRRCTRWLRVTVSSRRGDCEQISCTFEHVFYGAAGDHVHAIDLSIGDVLAADGDHVEVVAIEVVERRQGAGRTHDRGTAPATTRGAAEYSCTTRVRNHEEIFIAPVAELSSLATEFHYIDLGRTARPAVATHWWQW